MINPLMTKLRVVILKKQSHIYYDSIDEDYIQIEDAREHF